MTAKKASRGKARLHPLVRLTPRYSGRNSHGFWRRVNSLKGKDWDAAYSMGVALQNHEHTVLQFINAKPNAPAEAAVSRRLQPDVGTDKLKGD